MSMIIDYILLIAIAIGLSYSLISLWFLFVDYRLRKSPTHKLTIHPGVTIFKPLKGLDDCLENNLRSFFELDYPVYELIFGVQEYDDPAISLVGKLQAEYTHIPSQLIINTTRVGLNPKINNLFNSAGHRYFPQLYPVIKNTAGSLVPFTLQLQPSSRRQKHHPKG